VLVAARVHLAEGRSGTEFKLIADELDHRIRQRFPDERHVFLDPTPPERR
jgi:hypothetical protein